MRRVIAACVISRAGDWAFLVALNLWLLSWTGSALVVALATAAAILPRVIASVFTGALVDRGSAVRLMVVADVSRALLMLALAVTPPSVPVVLAVVLALSTLTAQFQAARGALLPRLVSDERLVQANAALAGADSLMTIVGPALGAWAVTSAGFGTTFLINAGSFVLSAVLLGGLPDGCVPATRSARPVPLAAGLLPMVALLAVSQGVVSALHAPFAVQVVGATAEAYAALLALQGAGGIAGAWLVARIDVPARTVLTAGLVLGGALTVVYASVPLYWVLAAVALVEGVLFSAVFIAIPTLVQRSIPPDRLGRAFAGLDATENAGMLAGTLAGGALAAVTTVQAACLVAGIGFATAGALAVKKEDRPWTTAS